MTKDEMNEFESDPNFNEILRIRYYDDNGKKIGVNIPHINIYSDLINKYINTNINNYIKEFENNGYILLKNFFDDDESKKIIDFKKQLEELDECKNKWMIYFEKILNQELKILLIIIMI